MPTIQELKEKHNRRKKLCKSCGSAVIWFKTKKGGFMPVDAATVKPSDDVLDLKYHRSHFATCPYADKHRRGRGETSSARR